MNTAAVVAISTLLATAAAAGVSVALRPSGDDGATMKFAALESSIGELRQANDKLLAELQALRDRPAPLVAGVAPIERREAAVVEPEQVAAAVDAYLAKLGAAGVAAAAGAEDAPFDLARDLDKLAGTDFWSNQKLWKKAFDAGLMDDVVAKFQAIADANPKDPESQMLLARACLAYVSMDPSKYQFSMQADKQFDKVLGLDDHHWEARFTKAVSYTFWPEMLGKKKDAISHFETLVDQQETMPVQDDQAQTYLYLGNLLAERDPERAAQVFRRGLQRHPNNTELQQKAGQ